MSSGESDTLGTPKTSLPQEQPPVSSATAFPDWATLQAYYSSVVAANISPPGFYHSVASSAHAYQYTWSTQPIIPAYGTPPPALPYVAMYTRGGFYPHRSIPLGSHPYNAYSVLPTVGTKETSVSVADGIDSVGKKNENGIATGASAKEDASESDGSAEQGSSEESGAPTTDMPDKKQHAVNATLLSAHAGPTTALNIGMDYWGGSTSSSTSKRSKLPVRPAGTTRVSLLSSSDTGLPSDLWLQDEREIKRQRRKQANRESARRSRSRKQAECEELAQRVGVLMEENNLLAEELRHLRESCEKLLSENASLSKVVLQLNGNKPMSDGIPIKLESVSEIIKEVNVVVARKVKGEISEDT